MDKSTYSNTIFYILINILIYINDYFKNKKCMFLYINIIK